MRRSVEQGDLGWDVWLDGVLQKDVLMADDGKGEVERYVHDDDGRLVVEGGGFKSETVYGKVEIRSSKQGLVAPVWSDAGEVPVGEVTYTAFTYELNDPALQAAFARIEKRVDKPADPNAKPALPALTRVSGNKRGPGWCDE